jgi:hypothetical protein
MGLKPKLTTIQTAKKNLSYAAALLVINSVIIKTRTNTQASLPRSPKPSNSLTILVATKSHTQFSNKTLEIRSAVPIKIKI